MRETCRASGRRRSRTAGCPLKFFEHLAGHVLRFVRAHAATPAATINQRVVAFHEVSPAIVVLRVLDGVQQRRVSCFQHDVCTPASFQAPIWTEEFYGAALPSPVLLMPAVVAYVPPWCRSPPGSAARLALPKCPLREKDRDRRTCRGPFFLGKFAAC